ncbi:MAG: sialate O-acetylesterase [bacterium]|nr:sialate O-acetylesterase [bacterium]
MSVSRTTIRTSLAFSLTAVVILAATLSGQAHAADLKLPAIFSDHAVLQQKAPVPVWGWGEPGATVSVAIDGKAKSATVDGDGRWRVDLSSMKAGGPYELTVSSGTQQIVLTDILIGEVWLASGQSNMQWSIKRTDNWEEVVANADNDSIRFAMVFRRSSPLPIDDLNGITPWAACTSDALTDCYNGEGFSAVSYYYAKYLQEALGVPVGVINTSWGGTRIEPWTPPTGFDEVPALKSISDMIRLNTPGSPEFNAMLSDGIAKVEAWLPEAKKAFETGAFPPALPAVASSSAIKNHGSPTALYNAMVAPLVPYANRGFIWYQGESNRGEGMAYRDKMEALIKGWRSVWNDKDLACYFVQLAPFRYGGDPLALPEIWEAQTATLELKGTGMAVINDIGDLDDIHPTNKDDVGKRLALLALKKTYGQRKVVCDSPLFDKFKVKGNTLRVHFKHAKGLTTRDGAAPSRFTIAGPDGVYRAANAVIDDATVLLTADGVDTPVAVRFAWDQCAEPNLMNEAGLPADAFRAGSIPVDGALRTQVPEAESLELLYALDPTNVTMRGTRAAYDVNNRAKLKGKRIERIGYYLQIVKADNDIQWVYAEMDAFTQDVNFIGVPIPVAGAQFQQDLGNLFVKTNVEGLPAGQLNGTIEMWACNYGSDAARGLEGASADKYDFDDTMSAPQNPGYGCLQIHDPASRTTLLAFNNHRGGRSTDVGIGNCTGANPDWTFSKSAEQCKSGKFLVVVKVAAE